VDSGRRIALVDGGVCALGQKVRRFLRVERREENPATTRLRPHDGLEAARVNGGVNAYANPVACGSRGSAPETTESGAARVRLCGSMNHAVSVPGDERVSDAPSTVHDNVGPH
jgi:hypothetical protein